jgi:hypothetical protein
MADVFISYIHEDEVVARALQLFITDKLKGLEVFVSSNQGQIYAGEVWLDKIRAELESARIVILLLSEKSIKRPWVNFEAGAAWLSNKVIIPVCVGRLGKGDLPKPYSNIQALDLRTDYYYLLGSLCHHLATPEIVFQAPDPFLGEEDFDLKCLIRQLDWWEDDNAPPEAL